MDGQAFFPLKGLGAEGMAICSSFQCNASSNPLSTTFRGPKGFIYTVTYAPTGIYTVALASGLGLPEQPFVVAAWPQYATLATDWFECGIVGDTTLNTTTRSFVIQAHRNGTAREPAATAGNRINFGIIFRNSTGA